MTSIGPIVLIGSGRIATALATAWMDNGLDVRVGARRAGSPVARTTSTSVEQAVRSAMVVMLAIPHQALDEVLPPITAFLEDRVVISCANPVRVLPDRSFVPDLPDGLTAGSALQARLPASKVGRAFSHVPAECLTTRATAASAAVRHAVAVAADAPQALDTTARLVDLAGFDSYPLGSLADSAPLDPGGLLWGSLLTTGDIRARLVRCGGAESAADGQ
jgi:8-hydroxy-5-deazaflavin:NADPH oxidoreductase